MQFAKLHPPARRRGVVSAVRNLFRPPCSIPCPSHFPKRPSRSLPPALSLPFCSALAPNAALQAPPIAAATQERRLSAVAWKRLILIEAPSSAYHRDMLRVAK